MKTLFLYTVQIYLFCSCTCIFGIPQPRPAAVSSNKVSYGENVKKCQVVNFLKSDFVDPEDLLCFGLAVFSQRLRVGPKESAAFEGVERKSDTDICKHFQEMRMNTTLGKLNESVTIYNLQFQNTSTCERACLDVLYHVRPLCSIILRLSRLSKENPIESDIQGPSTVLSGDEVDIDNNEVPEQSRKIIDPSGSLGEQKTIASDVEPVTVQQKLISNAQEKTIKGQKEDEGDKSERQNIDIPPAQISQGTNSAVTDNVSKLHEQTQQTDVKESAYVEGKPKATNEGRTLVTLHEQTQQTDEKESAYVEGKPKATNEGRTLVTGRAKGQLSTSGLLEENVHITPDNNAVMDTPKKTTNSNKEAKVSNAEDTHTVDNSNKEGKSDALLQKKEREPSSVVLPESSGGDKKEQVTAQRPKDSVTKKVVTVTDPKKEESNSQVPNVDEGKGIVNGQKSQADNKETENPSQKEAEVQTHSKITQVIPNSSTDKQKTNKNNEKVYTNENAETAPQLGETDTQKTINDNGPYKDDEDVVAAPPTPFSVDPGELPADNTDFSSGGGMGVYYARPDSDDLETDKNDMDAVAIQIHEKYEEDDDSHFFAYFMTTMVFCIVGYLLFHNKQKILALALEGRARRGRRRPNTSGYRKLDSNLEEAISSSKSASVTQVIY